MKTACRIISAATCIFLCLSFAVAAYFNITLPANYYIYRGEDKLNINCIVDVSAQVPKNSGSTKTELKILGVFTVKTVNVQSVDRPYLVPCGTAFGIKMLTDGVVVTSFGKVGDSGDVFELSPAGKAGIEQGDIICEINGEHITSSNKLVELVANSKGKADICYIRDGQQHTATVYPKKDENGEYKLGVWVRDSTAGIGTMTFYDESRGVYGGLGHAVCDIDTGEQLPLGSGEIVPATISSVKKGTSGNPGELCGTLISGISFGSIDDNSNCGLFGRTSLCPVSRVAVPMAFKQEVKTGKAYIISTVENAPAEEYEIEIESIDYGNSENKNMVIKVTDERLLEKSGGIVQGMSGSPIIQDGMLVGAVTHVFVSDPTHGYGIFAETMYDRSMNTECLLENAA